MRDFSQNGEQRLILAWAAAQRTAGWFLDIGAYDGETFSNTRALALTGWAGVAVEPAPDAARKLRDLYHEEIEVTVIEAAVTFADACELRWTPGRPFSSTVLARSQAGLVTVQAIHPDDQRLQPTDRPCLVSIDTEGTSLDLLDHYMRLPWVDCLCVEAHDDGHEQARALAMLDHQGGWQIMAANPVNVLACRTVVPTR